MSNYIKYFTRNALYFTAYLIITGTVIQTFLLELGIRESNVSVFVTVMSLTNVISTILFSSIADNSTKIINTMSKLFFIIGLTFITFIPLCLISNLNAFVIFLLILIIGILQTLFIAIRNVFEYKLPYLIIPMENFNILMGVDGVISGIAGIVFSLCMVFFINK
ncbi:MAG: hypothetical protein FWF15_10790 [Oscillospiraceae bacterium]|nr:hypothetical protein [Oscillospiraceae bacterium]